MDYSKPKVTIDLEEYLKLKEDIPVATPSSDNILEQVFIKILQLGHQNRIDLVSEYNRSNKFLKLQIDYNPPNDTYSVKITPK